MFCACDRSVAMATATGDATGGKKGPISNGVATKWRLCVPRRVASFALRSNLSFYCFAKFAVRRASETDDLVRESVIDITHFCTDGNWRHDARMGLARITIHFFFFFDNVATGI